MAIDNLPNGFTVPTRGEVRDQFQKDYLLRQPGAPTGEGSQAFIDGSVIADALMPLYADAVSIGRGADLADMTREQLKAECRALGIPEELPEGAGGGFVVISASAGGVFLDTGRELKDEGRNLRFHCAVAGTYYDGRAVPVIGTDKGPTTNLPAGARLKWTNPPSGLSNIATIQADADGNGFTGGRAAESDDDIRGRISTTRAEPPAAGNAAQIRTLVKEAGKALGIAIQEVFVYPAITGPGHYAYVFTLRPGSAGSTRIPDAIQIAAVRAFIARALPEDDGIFSAEIIEDPVTAKLGLEWAGGAEGWLDASPWPIFDDAFVVLTVTTSTAFTVHSDAASPTAPQDGQTFAFYDRANGLFAKKRILTASDVGGGSYDIVVDVTNNTSNAAYLPTVSQEFCPYSPSLDLLVDPLLAELDLLGPGEQENAPFDEGLRQRRMPVDPVEWPSALRHKSIDPIDKLPQVHDVSWLAPTIPHTPPVGVPGASSNIVAVTTILAFPP